MTQNALVSAHGFSAVMANKEAFTTAWNMAKMLSESGLVPKHFAGQPAACCVALIQAMELNENPIVLMQNMYIVHGMPGFSAKYQIARANKSGIFKGRIGWRVVDNGTRTIKGTVYRDLSVTAYATLAETGEEISFTVGLEMAELEGWLSNMKYRTMPELMYRYRSASILLRLYAPETLLGDSDVELETLPPQSAKTYDRNGALDVAMEEIKRATTGTAPPPGLRTEARQIEEATEVIDTEATEGEPAMAATIPTPADITAAENAYQDAHGVNALLALRQRITGAKSGKTIPAETLPAYLAALTGQE